MLILVLYGLSFAVIPEVPETWWRYDLRGLCETTQKCLLVCTVSVSSLTFLDIAAKIVITVQEGEQGEDSGQ